MDSVTLLGLALMGSLTFYALLGGADYGGGVWDLLARGPSAPRQRATIARAIGPVWEANHVWLIIAVVVLFTGFPLAFARLSTFLSVPLTLVLLGIVLRGSAFVFRSYGPDDPRFAHFWGTVFAVASAATPLFLGVVVGAITEGRLPGAAHGAFVDLYLRPWATPFSISVGLFALALFAYLAAVYLTLEARAPDERAAFRLRALASGVAVGATAATSLALAPAWLRSELMRSAWAIPLQIATGATAIAALVLLARRQFRSARLTAAVQVTLILWGWGLAQYPLVIRPDLTLADAAAPENVRVLLLQALGVGGVVLFPSLFYLFGVFGPRGARGSPEEAGS
jgi:cytochrome d ubiquinol oxidase subunit II